MKTTFSLILLLACGSAAAEIVEETVDFEYDGAPHKGYLYYDDNHSDKRPGILVVHEWWGLNAYARERAKQMAADGYVAFAMDMYGVGMVTEHPKQAGEWMTQVTSNVADWQKRAQLGFELLRGHEMTDGDKIAAIGYCFGGATVMQLAYSGADVKGVVSLHGSLPPASVEQAKAIQAAILIEHGNDDPFVPEERVHEFRGALDAAGIEYAFNGYDGVRHGFTNPDVAKYGIEALKYDSHADQQSTENMRAFFKKIFQ